jgi:hypothetical protein
MSSDPTIHRFPASLYPLSAAAMSLLLLTGCGSGMRSAINSATAGTPTTGTAPSTAIGAVLTYISPGAVMAGSPGTSLTLQGTSISSNAVVLMDGSAHMADYVSSSELHVPLSTAELAISQRHAFSVRNPDATTSDAKTLLVSSWYNAFGDSITEGYNLVSPATQNYTALLAGALNLAVTDNAYGGDQACDVFPRQIYGSGTGYTSQPAPLQSLMIGTNDIDVKGVGAYEAIFNTCDQAALAWLGTPRSSRLMAGDSGMATTGACTNAASIADYGGMACTAAGTMTGMLTTGGNAIYIWYTLRDSAAATSAFQITLDGVSAGNYNTLPAVLIGTQNGGHGSVALIRMPVAAGLHTVTVTTATGGIGIQGIGSNPASGTNLPRILVGDIPNQYLVSPVSTAASQLVYNADIAANVAMMAADSIDVRIAPTRNYMLGTLVEMNDSLHPNVLGQQHIEAAFLSVLP